MNLCDLRPTQPTDLSLLSTSLRRGDARARGQCGRAGDGTQRLFFLLFFFSLFLGGFAAREGGLRAWNAPTCTRAATTPQPTDAQQQ